MSGMRGKRVREATTRARDYSPHMIYQIRIVGFLDRQWTDWFDGMAISPTEDGDTVLTGPVEDQAALHGLLKKVRNAGMNLVSVVPIEPNKRRKEMK